MNGDDDGDSGHDNDDDDVDDSTDVDIDVAAYDDDHQTANIIDDEDVSR